jgi:hypothetical protein
VAALSSGNPALLAELVAAANASAFTNVRLDIVSGMQELLISGK